jgi:hypothetical protein
MGALYPRDGWLCCFLQTFIAISACWCGSLLGLPTRRACRCEKGVEGHGRATGDRSRAAPGCPASGRCLTSAVSPPVNGSIGFSRGTHDTRGRSGCRWTDRRRHRRLPLCALRQHQQNERQEGPSRPAARGSFAHHGVNTSKDAWRDLGPRQDHVDERSGSTAEAAWIVGGSNWCVRHVIPTRVRYLGPNSASVSRSRRSADPIATGR